MKLNKIEKEIKKMIENPDRFKKYLEKSGYYKTGDITGRFIPYSSLENDITSSIMTHSDLKIKYFKSDKNSAKELSFTKNTVIYLFVKKGINVYIVKDNDIKDLVPSVKCGDDGNNDFSTYELSFKNFLMTIIHHLSPLDDDTGYYLFGNIDKNYDANFVDFADIMNSFGIYKICEGSVNDKEAKSNKQILLYTQI